MTTCVPSGDIETLLVPPTIQPAAARSGGTTSWLTSSSVAGSVKSDVEGPLSSKLIETVTTRTPIPSSHTISARLLSGSNLRLTEKSPRNTPTFFTHAPDASPRKPAVALGEVECTVVYTNDGNVASVTTFGLTQGSGGSGLPVSFGCTVNNVVPFPFRPLLSATSMSNLSTTAVSATSMV